MPHATRLLVFPTKDLARAKALYGKVLGTAPYVDSPYYVGFRVGDQEVGLDPNGHKAGLTGPVAYWPVDDIATQLRALLDAGAQLHQDVKEVGGGRRTALVKDADGNVIGLMQG